MTKQPGSFYKQGGINAETYDTRTGGFAGEIDFYVAHAKASGGSVLEVACGTGRVTWPIARAGVSIVGIDLAPGMLEMAEQKRQQETREVSNRVRFVRGDMTSFDLGEQFALAIIPFRAFLMLLTVEQQRQALGCIRRHLRPGGRLIIDIFDPRHDRLAQETFGERREVTDMRNPVTGHLVTVTVVERVNDRVQQRLRERWIFREAAADGTVVREEEEVLEIRWIFRYEMHHLFELSGFVVEEEQSDYLGAPPAYGLEQIWMARRAGS
jgi:ubiquinone/menaquinone biosynthesis C-methylase UbiE